MKVATRWSLSMPRPRRALASWAAWVPTSAYDIRRGSCPVQVTTSWSAYSRVPDRRIREISNGDSCMVLFMARLCHASPAGGRAREWGPQVMRLDGGMRRPKIITSVVAGVVAVAAVAGGFAYAAHRQQAALTQEARTSADRFAGAWSHRSVKDVGYAGRSSDQVAASFKSTTSGLGDIPVKVTLASLTREGDKATGALSVAWTVADGKAWTYPVPISVQRGDGERWVVVAKEGASMWAPGLSADAKLVAKRTWGRRGDVLGRDGSPILASGKVFDVSIDPVRASAGTVAQLE